MRDFVEFALYKFTIYNLLLSIVANASDADGLHR